MKYAVAGNEFHARSHIISLVSDLRPDWQLAFEAETVQEIIEGIQRDGEPDIMFLDIELNDGNVFELFKKIDVRVPVVFTTAYDDYCLQAFKVNSLDYVMKPISMDTLLFAIRKFETMGRGAVDPSRYADLSLPQQEADSDMADTGAFEAKGAPQWLTCEAILGGDFGLKVTQTYPYAVSSSRSIP